MNLFYYDNADIQPDETGHVDIDRVYCFSFHEFTDDDWEKLSSIYPLLPGNINKNGQPTQIWFGKEHLSPDKYLWASVEPPGLQVAGKLTMEEWKRWESAFHQQLKKYSFPSYEC